MLMIRLQRVGRKHDASYRVVVTEKTRGPKSGDYVESIGNHDPRKEKGKTTTINAERAKHWISVGAKPSDTVHNLLVRAGIIEGSKRSVHAKSKKEAEVKDSPKISTEQAAAEAPAQDTVVEETSETPAEEIKEEKKAEETEVVQTEAKAEEAPAEQEKKD